MIGCPDPDLHRRAGDGDMLIRATGHSAKQLMLQVLGGLMIAGAVGGISVWGTSLVLGERLGNLAEQLREMKVDVQRIRSDFYPPRFNRSDGANTILPPGRP